MATLQARLGDLITALGTDYKSIMAKIGTIGSLTTTATDLVAAVNEVKVTADAAGGATPDASTTVKGKVELATDGETTTGTDTVRATTPSNVKAAIDARVVAATTSVSGIVELATTGESTTGTDTDRATTPAGVKAVVDARVITATSSAAGISELASDAEALALSATDRVVTPGNLGAIVNVNNGLAKLDAGGKIASAQLPAYVDDVLESANLAAFPGTGTAGIIYVAIDTNKTYRWSGSAYVEISPSPGTTDSLTEGSTNLYFTNTRADTRADGRITALIGDPDTNLASLYTTAKA